MNEEDVDETTRLMSGEVAYEDNDTSSRDRRPRSQRGDENTDAVREDGSSSLLQLVVSLCFIVLGTHPRKPHQQ